jgi:hypothetical protein
VAHKFPDITTYGAALRFALEAEQACADLAAAAGVLAPDQPWRDRLEEIVCTHDDRVAKLASTREETGSGGEGVSLDATVYLGVLDAEPDIHWPGVVEQLARAEDDAARFHDDFATQCAALLGERARLFQKSATQDRAAGTQLRGMLG